MHHILMIVAMATVACGSARPHAEMAKAIDDEKTSSGGDFATAMAVTGPEAIRNFLAQGRIDTSPKRRSKRDEKATATSHSDKPRPLADPLTSHAGSDFAGKDDMGESVTEGEELDEPVATGEAIELDRSFCSRQLDGVSEVASCTARTTALGAAIAIEVERSCSDADCRPQTWIKLGERPPQRLAIKSAAKDLRIAGAAVTVDLRYAFVGDVSASASSDYGVRLWRVDLVRDYPERWVDCAAPVLSPSGSWIVCRTESGDVARFAPATRELAVVHKIARPAGVEVYREPSGQLVLDPLVFPGEGLLRVTTRFADGTDKTENVEWSE